MENRDDEDDHKHNTTGGEGSNTGDNIPTIRKGKGKLSTLGKIFKPWKWRKKKGCDKFTETSEVLERKMSMRRPRQELIEQGVLKELPDNEGDVPHSPKLLYVKNGHTLPVGVGNEVGDGGRGQEARSPLDSGMNTSDFRINPAWLSQAEDRHFRFPMDGDHHRGQGGSRGQGLQEECWREGRGVGGRPQGEGEWKSNLAWQGQGMVQALGEERSRGGRTQPSDIDKRPGLQKASSEDGRRTCPAEAEWKPNLPCHSFADEGRTCIGELTQAGRCSSQAQAKPSPPMPPKRTTPVTKRHPEDTSASGQPVSTPSPALLSHEDHQNNQSVGLELPPPSPSPPLPTHTPPSPPCQHLHVHHQHSYQHPIPQPMLFDPPSPTSESPQRPASVPLHIMIQRALSSPGPAQHHPDGSQRSAHSLLFETPAECPLAVSLQPLKLSDDDYSEEDEDEEEEYDGELPHPELEPWSRRCMVGEPSVIHEVPKSSEDEEDEEEQDLQREDSDFDGAMLYKDEDSDEEDKPPQSALASRVIRKDTLALKLSNRHAREDQSSSQTGGHTPGHVHQGSTGLTWQSREQWEAIRTQIGSALTRRLSQRPSAEELEQRNILQSKNHADRQAEVREIKRRLTRKLSQRPTVAELQARKILRFHEYVEVTTANDYDRRAEKPWTRLTPADKAAIRKELNDFKSSEMEVHKDSMIYTRYHRP